MAIVIALAAAIPLGTLSAYKAGSAVDRGVTGTSFALLAGAQLPHGDPADPGLRRDAGLATGDRAGPG